MWQLFINHELLFSDIADLVNHNAVPNRSGTCLAIHLRAGFLSIGFSLFPKTSYFVFRIGFDENTISRGFCGHTAYTGVVFLTGRH